MEVPSKLDCHLESKEMKQEHAKPNKDHEKDVNASNSNPNPCPICLGFTSQESYLDRCYHRFCHQCIIRWIQVVSSRSSSLHQASSIKCPLCKIENYSVIHGFDGSTFQRHFINPNSGNSNFFTKGHKYRLLCYYTEPKPGLLSDAFKVERFWKSHKYLQHNMWLEKWLRRELQALMQEEDVEIIMHHILGVIESFSRSHHPKGTPHLPQQKQGEFKVLVTNAATPFLAARTNRFVVEVELFLASGLTVEAYDRAYRRCLGWETPEKTSHGNEETSSERQPIAPTLYFIDDDFDEVDGVENEDVYA